MDQSFEESFNPKSSKDVYSLSSETVRENASRIFYLLFMRKDNKKLSIRKEYKQLLNWVIKTAGLTPLVITNDSIEKLVDHVNSLSVNEWSLYPVINVENPLMLLRAGFVPKFLDYSYKLYYDYIKGIDVDTLDWWYVHNSFKKEINLMKECPVWVYYSLSEWKKRALEEADSFGLLLFKEKVYPRSNRPITDMSLYKSPLSFTYSYGDIINNTLVISDTKWKVLPVTRYSAGMSKGLYFQESSTKKCGTFFYLEEDSTTYLAYQTSVSSFNKVSMFKLLYTRLMEENKEFRRLMENFEEERKDKVDHELGEDMHIWVLSKTRLYLSELHSNGNLPKDLMMTPSEYLDVVQKYNLQTKYFKVDDKKKDIDKISQKKYYTGIILPMYASEDDYDQPLCIMGKMLGIDLLILESMVGSFQVVTEVLDTRSREECFRSLVYLSY